MLNEIDIAKLPAPAELRSREVPLRGLPRRVSLNPLVRNVGLTGLTSLLTAVAAMVVISLVGRLLGPALLGEYLLLRRMASWLQAAVVLPSGIALPRYVAACVNEPHAAKQGYFLAASVAGSALAIVLMILFSLRKDITSRLIFGSAQMASLAPPLGLLLLGLAAHAAAFGFYQGMLSMGRACLLQFCNLVMIPILAIALLFKKHSIPLIIDATGLSMLLCTLLFSFSILHGSRLADLTRRAAKGVSELLSFGLSRTWGDFGLQALLSLPAVIAAHYLPMTSVSFLLLGGSFLALVAAATLPLGIILLSQVTRALAQDRKDQLKKHLAHFIDALIESSALVSLQMLIFADAIIVIWVGPNFTAATRIVQILILAVPFYFVYGGLRSVLDAAARKAHNTRNILISLGVFLVATLVVTFGLARDFLLQGLAASVVVAMAVQACLTLRSIRQLFGLRVGWRRLFPGIVLAAALGACSLWLRGVAAFRPTVISLFLYELVIAGVYFSVLWVLGTPWLRFLASSMFRLRSAESQPAQ
jgi:O-antigen/teichoic acid export membrane protein